MNELVLEKGRALVVVAHPDDETIWMGGMMLRYPYMQWIILALCRQDDSDRMPKFLTVAKHYGAKGVISDLEDDDIMNIKESVPEIEQRIKRALSNKNFDYIFTHDTNGEYGHPRHKGVHHAVKNLIVGSKLVTRQCYFFAYKLDEERGIAVPSARASHMVNLSLAEFKEKRCIVKEFYGFGKNSFENRSCSKREMFKMYK